MTLLLWGGAVVLWVWAIYLLARVPVKTPPPPADFVSSNWLAQYRRGRDES